MRLYSLDKVLVFGKYKGKTLRDIINDRRYGYINWCAINVENFCISHEVVTEIKNVYGFELSEEALKSLRNKQWLLKSIKRDRERLKKEFAQERTCHEDEDYEREYNQWDNYSYAEAMYDAYDGEYEAYISDNID